MYLQFEHVPFCKANLYALTTQPDLKERFFHTSLSFAFPVCDLLFNIFSLNCFVLKLGAAVGAQAKDISGPVRPAGVDMRNQVKSFKIRLSIRPGLTPGLPCFVLYFFFSVVTFPMFPSSNK